MVLHFLHEPACERHVMRKTKHHQGLSHLHRHQFKNKNIKKTSQGFIWVLICRALSSSSGSEGCPVCLLQTPYQPMGGILGLPVGSVTSVSWDRLFPWAEGGELHFALWFYLWWAWAGTHLLQNLWGAECTPPRSRSAGTPPGRSLAA